MKVNIFGVPSYAGALYKGTEQTPQALRNAGLVNKLRDCSFEVEDHGDIDNYSDLPRHNIPPVRNWPAPRIVWESIVNKANELFDKEAFTLLLGGDCSMEVGSFNAFSKIHGDNSHLLVMDGHVDLLAPQGDTCIGAAGMGLWFLTQDNSTWWNTKKENNASNVSVIGAQEAPEDCKGIRVTTLKDIKNDTKLNCVKQHLKTIPEDDSILVHFDVDILNSMVMPAAYSPSKEGLDYEEAISVFKLILSDSRVKAMEITEFDPQKDTLDGKAASVILELICLLENNDR